MENSSSLKPVPRSRSRLKHQLPELYLRLIPGELLNFSMPETKATCGSCAMSREARGPRAKRVYRADLKCCTFDPILPNYLVGAILEDSRSSAWARQSLRRKMSSHEECLPLGLRPTTGLQREFLRQKDSAFGQREDWRCPYLDPEASNCSIWRNRGNVCASFFCFSDMGALGLRFWQDLGHYLHLIEMTLMEEALVHLDFSPRQISELLAYIDPREHMRQRALAVISGREWRRFWNSYSDPDEFFRKCYAFVSSLSRMDVEAALGEAGERQFAELMRRLRLIEERRG